jgi:predicted DNA-binding transcriptional regulator AlpA
MSDHGAPTLKEIPSLNSLVADPGKALSLPPDVARTLLCGLAGVLPVLIAQSLKVIGKPESSATPERFLTVDEAVARFGVSRQWLYRHAKQMPHSQPSRKTLLFPENATGKWFASRKG